jgi:hypothetical protein
MIQQSFNSWLTNIIQTEKPTPSIIAWYFGIVQTTNGYMIHLAGSAEFDKDDDDWACNTDFIPESAYFELGDAEKDWEDVLSDVQLLIKEFKKTSEFKGSFLVKAKAIATGFDDGDLLLIK